MLVEFITAIIVSILINMITYEQQCNIQRYVKKYITYDAHGSQINGIGQDTLRYIIGYHGNLFDNVESNLLHISDLFFRGGYFINSGEPVDAVLSYIGIPHTQDSCSIIKKIIKFDDKYHNNIIITRFHLQLTQYILPYHAFESNYVNLWGKRYELNTYKEEHYVVRSEIQNMYAELVQTPTDIIEPLCEIISQYVI